MLTSPPSFSKRNDTLYMRVDRVSQLAVQICVKICQVRETRARRWKLWQSRFQALVNIISKPVINFHHGRLPSSASPRCLDGCKTEYNRSLNDYLIAISCNLIKILSRTKHKNLIQNRNRLKPVPSVTLFVASIPDSWLLKKILAHLCTTKEDFSKKWKLR